MWSVNDKYLMKRIFEDILDDIEPLQTNSAAALSDDDSFWIDYADIDYDQSADDYDMSICSILINFVLFVELIIPLQ